MARVSDAALNSKLDDRDEAAAVEIVISAGEPELQQSTNQAPIAADELAQRQSINQPLEWHVKSLERSTRTFGGPRNASEVLHSLRQCCGLLAWRQRLPISVWITKYGWQDLQGDLIAGVTVGLTVIPQALAYSQIAELPLEYGLYSSFMGCFMYTLFGSSRHVTLGATAIISLLTAEAYPKDAGLFKAQYATLLCFFTGIIQLLMGALNLGFLINFISTPVISGFTSASAFVIMYGQVKSVLGVSFGKSTDTVIAQTSGYLANLSNINGWDVLMGTSCMALILLLKSLRLPRTSKNRYLRETLRLISVCRYGIVVIMASLVGFLLEHYLHDRHPLTLTREVKAGLPPFQLPAFAFDNKTFPEVFSGMGSGLAVVSLVGAMESIAIAKAFAHQFHYNIDSTQEFLALGMANFMSSFVSSYPVTGSFTKSALNAQSGVRTSMGCVFTGGFVIISMALFSAAFRYVPRAALGAIIICAVSVMFEFKIFRDLWLLNRKELLPLTVTIAVSLFFGVDYGLLAGISLSLILLLYPLARPPIDVDVEDTLLTAHSQLDGAAGSTEKRVIQISVTPQGALYFPSAEYVKEFFDDDVLHLLPAIESPNLRTDSASVDLQGEARIGLLAVEEIVVFNGLHLINSDYTTLRGLRSIVMSCKKAGKTLQFINTPKQVLRIVLPKEIREKVLTGGSTASDVNETVTVQFSKSLPEKLACVAVDDLMIHEPQAPKLIPAVIRSGSLRSKRSLS
ncbi:Sodium-independent sulfate anion transporter [Hypsibius exemplaris]|uniref:Sodium-independent sulfate anion transporter n=1 Tax=Hypsibius exemplaris TaxID=2072580 RepID=A0A1W0WYH6_HYPEX|nr:Sodium-independent sulfate anion transporter [Hypsibius exemplaris]